MLFVSRVGWVPGFPPLPDHGGLYGLTNVSVFAASKLIFFNEKKIEKDSRDKKNDV